MSGSMNGDQIRVVIVDDHPIWRDALERDLAANGYDVVGAFGDGEAAVRTAARTAARRRADGPRAARHVRRRDRRRPGRR